MEPILTVSQMRELDSYYINHVSSGQELMGRAGAALADELMSFKRIAILCGSGNNGGDGYAATYSLINRSDAAFEVIDIFYIKKPRSSEAAYFYENISDECVSVSQYTKGVDLAAYDCVVDCLLGTGFEGVPSGLVAAAIEDINGCENAFVISMDINSGVNGDSGEGELFVVSDLTISLGYKKRGFLSEEFRDKTRELKNVNIGYDLSPDHLSPFETPDDIMWS